MLACEAVMHGEIDVVAPLGAEIAARYGGADLPSSRPRCARRPPSASALQFVERRRVSWDHRKLGGTY